MRLRSISRRQRSKFIRICCREGNSVNRYRGCRGSKTLIHVKLSSQARDLFLIYIAEHAFASDGTLRQYSSNESVAPIRCPCPASADLHASQAVAAAVVAAAVVCAFAEAASSVVRAAVRVAAASVR